MPCGARRRHCACMRKAQLGCCENPKRKSRISEGVSTLSRHGRSLRKYGVGHRLSQRILASPALPCRVHVDLHIVQQRQRRTREAAKTKGGGARGVSMYPVCVCGERDVQEGSGCAVHMKGRPDRASAIPLCCRSSDTLVPTSSRACWRRRGQGHSTMYSSCFPFFSYFSVVVLVMLGVGALSVCARIQRLFNHVY